MTFLCLHHGPVEASFRGEMAFCPFCLERVEERVADRVCEREPRSPYERLKKFAQKLAKAKVGGA